MSSASDEEKHDAYKDHEHDHDGKRSAVPAQDASTFPTVATAPAPPPPAPSMDGGLRAWLQVAGSFVVFGNLWGPAFAFGSFQSYYELDYIPQQSASSISWIGTVSVFLLILIGVFSGPLFDLGYFRIMLIVGALLETLAFFLMSVSKTYWQLMLTQGVLMGLGNGLLYLPGLALVGRSFKRRRAIAMGVTTCGAPVGGVIYTLIFEQLIGRLGFGWTVRVMGFVMLGCYCFISFPLLLWGVSNLGDLSAGTTRKLFDPTALKDAPFLLYTSSNFFIFCGYLVPFIFIPSYGQLVLGISRSLSLYISMISQASSIIGRLVAGYAAGRIGVMINWYICVLVSGAVCVAWHGATSLGSFIAIAALYGAFSGALIPLPPSVFPIVCPDPNVFGARLGMAQAFGSIASLIGPPIAARLATASSNHAGQTNFLGLQLFSGLIMIVGSCNLLCLWFVLIRRRPDGGSKWV